MARRLPTPWPRFKKDPKTGRCLKNDEGHDIFEWYVTIPATKGKSRQQKFLADMDASEEKVREALLLALNEAHVDRPGVEIALQTVAQQYLGHVETDQSPKTFRIRNEYIQSFFGWLKGAGLATIPCKDLQPFHVTRWLKTHPEWRNNTRRMAVLSVKTCVNWAYKEGLLTQKVLERMEVPAETFRGQEVILSPGQRHLLIEHCTCNEQKYVLIALYASGCRPGELCNLLAEDVNLGQDTPIWRVRGKPTKANRTGVRNVALDPALVTITKKLLEEHPTGPLFRNTGGTRWTPGLIDAFVYRVRRRVLKKGHILPDKVIPYGMRHTFATDLIKGGAHDYDVAKLMGHAGTKMVHQVYAKHDVSTASRALEHLRDTQGDLKSLEANPKARKAPTPSASASAKKVDGEEVGGAADVEITASILN